MCRRILGSIRGPCRRNRCVPLRVSFVINTIFLQCTEASFRAAELTVISNTKSYRRDPNVPLVVPLLNPLHLNIIPRQRALHSPPLHRGFIITNANCSTTGIVIRSRRKSARSAHRVLSRHDAASPRLRGKGAGKENPGRKGPTVEDPWEAARSVLENAPRRRLARRTAATGKGRLLVSLREAMVGEGYVDRPRCDA
jgi:hypothetical protein